MDVVITTKINGVTVTSIGWNAFEYNGLLEIKMPANVTLFTFEGNDLMGKCTEFKCLFDDNGKEAVTYVRADVNCWEKE